MAQWWSGIGDFERIFWVIAFPAIIVFVLQVIMTLMGIGDNDNDIGGIEDLMEEVPQDSVELDLSDSPGEFLDFKFKLVTIRSLK